MSKWKRLAGIVLGIGMLVVSMTMSVQASAINTWGNLTAEETTASFSTDTAYNLLRGVNLNQGTVTISKISSTEIDIYGFTQCHHFCADVYLDIYLERKINGVYSTYKYWEFEAHDAASMSRELQVAVPSGYYYRVRGYHAARDGGIKESTSTLTQGVLIN